MPIEIDTPFRLDQSGRVLATADPNRQIRNHVMSLVNTSPGERLVIRDYGIPLLSAVFESGAGTVAGMLGSTIRSALAKWEPGVRLLSVSPVSTDESRGTAMVDVQYERVDAPNTAGSSSTNYAAIRVGGHVSEVVRG